jgi:DNA-binding CsgD family transcriptional regulator
LTVVPTYVLWDEESNHSLCVRQLRTVRDAGALARLPIDLATFILLAVRCGDFAAAADTIAEADALSEATGTGMVFSAMMLAAFRGGETQAVGLIESARKAAADGGQGVGSQVAQWMLAVLCNARGRYREAMGAAQDASDARSEELFGTPAWATAELVEAAARSGAPDVASSALERLAETITAAGSDSALGILARSRALVSDGGTAECLYQEAIERLSRTRLRPELARAHLLYGEWLRREGRRVEARERLRTAHEMFLAIGMEAFAERARGELLATGEKLRRRTVETRDDLTAQERQIARLARDGLSNPEIGARLFLSPRTVEWHLRNVFNKLDIRSRRELARTLPSTDGNVALA